MSGRRTSRTASYASSALLSDAPGSLRGLAEVRFNNGTQRSRSHPQYAANGRHLEFTSGGTFCGVGQIKLLRHHVWTCVDEKLTFFRCCWIQDEAGLRLRSQDESGVLEAESCKPGAHHHP